MGKLLYGGGDASSGFHRPAEFRKCRFEMQKVGEDIGLVEAAHGADANYASAQLIPRARDHRAAAARAGRQRWRKARRRHRQNAEDRALRSPHAAPRKAADAAPSLVLVPP